MKIQVVYPQRNSKTDLEVKPETTLSLVRSLIEIELQVPVVAQVLCLGDKELSESDDESSLYQLGIVNGVQLVLTTFNGLTSNEGLTSNQPPVDSYARNEDSATIVSGTERGLPSPKGDQLKEVHYCKERWLRALSDPFSQEAQELMLQQIRERELDEALLHAQEYLPESFGSVSMVYIKVELNNIQLIAFIDSGAQSTIISERCANRCGLMRHIDKRFRGMAQGLGSTKILGRVHVAQLRLGSTYFAASLVVLEDSKIDFLFGLDLLRRHQCTLDFQKNILRIANEEISFLSEHEIQASLLGEPSSEGSLPPLVDVEVSSRLRSINQGRAKQEIQEARIQKLLDIGATREKAICALVKAKWNLDEAAALYCSENERNNSEKQ